MGGLGGMQNNMPNVGTIAPANGMGNGQANIDATLSQAYTGIQQYAGLSGLVNQGKFHLTYLCFSFTMLMLSGACRCVLPPLRAVREAVMSPCRSSPVCTWCGVMWCFLHWPCD